MPGMAIPLAADKLDAWEAWIAELNGPRKAAFDDMNARHGLTGNRAYLQPTPDGGFLVLVITDGSGPEAGAAMEAAVGLVKSTSVPYLEVDKQIAGWRGNAAGQ